jgi:DNA-binding CsgD family transcriptional regulator
MVTSDSRPSEDRFERSGSAIAAARPDLLAHVSTAQQRVLELLLAGLTEPQIAERIGRSRHTVHDHTKAIYAALRVSNRVQLVLLFSVPAQMPAKPAMTIEAQPQRAARLATVIPTTGSNGHAHAALNNN